MTFAATVNPIVDALLELVELPDDEKWGKSSSDTAPATWEPNQIYAWARNQKPQPAGLDGGDQSELWFFLSIAWAVGTDEETGQIRDRDVGDVIDDAFSALYASIAGNRSSDVWEWIEVEFADPHSNETFSGRVGRIDLRGYRIV